MRNREKQFLGFNLHDSNWSVRRAAWLVGAQSACLCMHRLIDPRDSDEAAVTSSKMSPQSRVGGWEIESRALVTTPNVINPNSISARNCSAPLVMVGSPFAEWNVDSDLMMVTMMVHFSQSFDFPLPPLTLVERGVDTCNPNCHHFPCPCLPQLALACLLLGLNSSRPYFVGTFVLCSSFLPCRPPLFTKSPSKSYNITNILIDHS